MCYTKVILCMYAYDRKLDRKSSSIYDDEFGMFYGEFESGKKEGYGIEINVRLKELLVYLCMLVSMYVCMYVYLYVCMHGCVLVIYVYYLQHEILYV